MDVRFLTTFLEITKTRHFGKAAENLYLTPAAVSSRIKHLEEYFNALLFTRVRNGIQLTPAGESLVPFAQNIESSLKLARAALAQEDVAFVACGLSANAAELILTELTDALFTHLPKQLLKASVKAEVASVEQLSRQLHERTIGLAFAHEPFKSANIDNILVRNESLQIFSDGASITNLSAQNFLHIEWTTEVTQSLAIAYPETKRSHFRTNSVSIALKQFKAQGGFIVLPSHYGVLLPNVIALSPPHGISIPQLKTYMVCMQEGRHPSLTELIAHLTLAFKHSS